MPSRHADRICSPPDGAVPPATRAPWWRAALVFGAVAVVLWSVATLSVAFLPWSSHPRVGYFRGQPWFEGWVQWDAGWYREIATHGYSYTPGRQSPVAFFPAYPLAMRAGGAIMGSPLLAGILLTVACGAAVASMLWTWFRDHMSPVAAMAALALFLVYPYAFYLYGVVYADALFIAAVVAAFLLLERDHAVAAGLAGAVATAARPVGLVVVAGLTVRALERRGVFPRGVFPGGVFPGGKVDAGAGGPEATPGPRRGGGIATLVDARRAQRRDAGVLLSVAGLAAYCLYLALRFGRPFLFADVERYWGQAAGPHTWLKIEFVRNALHPGDFWPWVAFVAHPVVTLAALALVPRVFRRFGWGYGVYSLLAVGLAAFSTKDFFGCGRYVLAAFPCFAVAAEALVARPRALAWVLGVSAAALVVMTSLFARGAYLS